MNEQDAPDKTHTKKQKRWKQGQVTQDEARHCLSMQGWGQESQSPLGVESGKGHEVQQDRQQEWLLQVLQELKEGKTRQGVSLLLNAVGDLVTKDTEKKTLVLLYAFFTGKTCLQESQALKPGVRKTYHQ